MSNPIDPGMSHGTGLARNLARTVRKLRRGILVGTWRETVRGALWELMIDGGVSFGIGRCWSGSVALGVITIRSSGLACAVPQAGVAHALS